jgi:hypothetical protein
VINRAYSRFGLAAIFAVCVAATGLIAEAQIAAPGQSVDAKTPTPVLMKKDSVDVDGDGTMDAVSYFDSNGDDIVDAEAIDLGATGTVDVLAIRCDADGDGRTDDWAVVNAETEEVTAALIDANDDGEADAVAYGDGKRESLPVATSIIKPVFHY